MDLDQRHREMERNFAACERRERFPDLGHYPEDFVEPAQTPMPAPITNVAEWRAWKKQYLKDCGEI